MRLSDQQYAEFYGILKQAYNLGRLDLMLRLWLGVDREAIALGNDRDEIFMRVLDDFQRREKTTELVVASRLANPDNQTLFGFAQRLGLAPKTLVREGSLLKPTFDQSLLERKVRASNSSLDPVKWRTQMYEVEGRVCRIEITTSTKRAYGTGFLVNDDVVLTNYHVMEDVIAKSIEPRNVALRFDFKMLADGTTINSGKVCRLAAGENWYIDHSEYSPIDEMTDPPQGESPDEKHLDYALLRLSEAIGKQPVGEDAGAGAPPRHWIKLSEESYPFPADTALNIAQHPEGEPLKIVLDTEAVIGVNANGTRVRYRTNTEQGSSGSPCFDMDWKLVALHHSGDPNYEELHKPEYNQGIPTDAIYRLLKTRGKESNLG